MTDEIIDSFFLKEQIIPTFHCRMSVMTEKKDRHKMTFNKVNEFSEFFIVLYRQRKNIFVGIVQKMSYH